MKIGNRFEITCRAWRGYRGGDYDRYSPPGFSFALAIRGAIVDGKHSWARHILEFYLPSVARDREGFSTLPDTGPRDRAHILACARERKPFCVVDMYPETPTRSGNVETLFETREAARDFALQLNRGFEPRCYEVNP